MRGGDVRSRLAIRQYKTKEKRDDVFAPTQDTFFPRYQVYRLSNDRNLAAMILDVSVAFMHAYHS